MASSNTIEILLKVVDAATSPLGLATAGVTALAAGVADAVNVAADFEAQMNGIKAILTPTSAEFKTLSDLALKMGADTSFSAMQAAEAIEELGSAGMSTKDIIAGGLQGALALAAGTGMKDLGQAAEISATALNTFKLKGEDVGRVADVVANAANISAMKVTDFAAALSSGGSVAQASKLSLTDFTAALTLLADAGVKGSDAGTSLKSALMNAQAPAASTKRLMDELGFSLYDADGKMKSLRDIVANLESSFRPLTEAQRNEAAATIFGSDGIRTFNALLGAGVTGLDERKAALDRSGSAEQAAKARLEGLKGAQEQLNGSVETLKIVIGSAFLPALASIVGSVTGGVNKVMELVSAFRTGGTAVTDLAQKYPQLSAAIDAVKPYINALGTLFRTAFELARTTWDTVLKPTLNAIRPLVEGVFNAIGPIVRVALDAVSGLFRSLSQLLRGDFSGAFETVRTTFQNAIPLLRQAATSIINGILEVVRGLGAQMATLAGQAVQGFINGLAAAPAQVANAAKNMADAAVGSVKGALGIHSPSVVFRQIGEQVVAGLVGGIENQTASASAAAKAMADAVKAAASNIRLDLQLGNIDLGDAREKLEALKTLLDQKMASVNRGSEAWREYAAEAVRVQAELDRLSRASEQARTKTDEKRESTRLTGIALSDYKDKLDRASVSTLEHMAAAARAAGQDQQYALIKAELKSRTNDHTESTRLSGIALVDYKEKLDRANVSTLEAMAATARAKGEDQQYALIKAELKSRTNEHTESTRLSGIALSDYKEKLDRASISTLESMAAAARAAGQDQQYALIKRELAQRAKESEDAHKLEGVALINYKEGLDRANVSQLQAAEAKARAANDGQRLGLILAELKSRTREAEEATKLHGVALIEYKEGLDRATVAQLQAAEAKARAAGDGQRLALILAELKSRTHEHAESTKLSGIALSDYKDKLDRASVSTLESMAAAARAAGQDQQYLLIKAELTSRTKEHTESTKLSGVALIDYKASLDNATVAQLQAAEAKARAANDGQRLALILAELKQRSSDAADATKLQGVALADYKTQLDNASVAQLRDAETRARAANDGQRLTLILAELKSRTNEQEQAERAASAERDRAAAKASQFADRLTDLTARFRDVTADGQVSASELASFNRGLETLQREATQAGVVLPKAALDTANALKAQGAEMVAATEKAALLKPATDLLARASEALAQGQNSSTTSLEKLAVQLENQARLTPELADKLSTQASAVRALAAQNEAAADKAKLEADSQRLIEAALTTLTNAREDNRSALARQAAALEAQADKDVAHRAELLAQARALRDLEAAQIAEAHAKDIAKTSADLLKGATETLAAARDGDTTALEKRARALEAQALLDPQNAANLRIQAEALRQLEVDQRREAEAKDRAKTSADLLKAATETLAAAREGDTTALEKRARALEAQARLDPVNAANLLAQAAALRQLEVDQRREAEAKDRAKTSADLLKSATETLAAARDGDTTALEKRARALEAQARLDPVNAANLLAQAAALRQLEVDQRKETEAKDRAKTSADLLRGATETLAAARDGDTSALEKRARALEAQARLDPQNARDLLAQAAALRQLEVEQRRQTEAQALAKTSADLLKSATETLTAAREGDTTALEKRARALEAQARLDPQNAANLLAQAAALRQLEVDQRKQSEAQAVAKTTADLLRAATETLAAARDGDTTALEKRARALEAQARLDPQHAADLLAQAAALRQLEEDQRKETEAKNLAKTSADLLRSATETLAAAREGDTTALEKRARALEAQARLDPQNAANLLAQARALRDLEAAQTAETQAKNVAKTSADLLKAATETLAAARDGDTTALEKRARALEAQAVLDTVNAANLLAQAAALRQLEAAQTAETQAKAIAKTSADLLRGATETLAAAREGDTTALEKRARALEAQALLDTANATNLRAQAQALRDLEAAQTAETAAKALAKTTADLLKGATETLAAARDGDTTALEKRARALEAQAVLDSANKDTLLAQAEALRDLEAAQTAETAAKATAKTSADLLKAATETLAAARDGDTSALEKRARALEAQALLDTANHDALLAQAAALRDLEAAQTAETAAKAVAKTTADLLKAATETLSAARDGDTSALEKRARALEAQAILDPAHKADLEAEAAALRQLEADQTAETAAKAVAKTTADLLKGATETLAAAREGDTSALEKRARALEAQALLDTANHDALLAQARALRDLEAQQNSETEAKRKAKDAAEAQTRALDLSREATDKLAEMTGGKATPAWELYARKLDEAAKTALPATKAELERLAEAIRNAGQAAEDAKAQKEVFGQWADAFHDASERLKGTGVVVIDVISQLAEGVSNVLKAAAEHKWPEAISAAGTALAGALRATQDDMASVAADIVETLAGIFSSLASGNWVGAIVAAVSGVVQTIIGWFTRGAEEARRLAEGSARQFMSSMQTIADAHMTELENMHNRGEISTTAYYNRLLQLQIARLTEEHNREIGDLQDRYNKKEIDATEFDRAMRALGLKFLQDQLALEIAHAEQLRTRVLSIIGSLSSVIADSLADSEFNLEKFETNFQEALKKTLINAISKAVIESSLVMGQLQPLINEFLDLLEAGNFDAAGAMVNRIAQAGAAAAQALAPVMAALNAAIQEAFGSPSSPPAPTPPVTPPTGDSNRVTAQSIVVNPTPAPTPSVYRFTADAGVSVTQGAAGAISATGGVLSAVASGIAAQVPLFGAATSSFETSVRAIQAVFDTRMPVFSASTTTFDTATSSFEASVRTMQTVAQALSQANTGTGAAVPAFADAVSRFDMATQDHSRSVYSFELAVRDFVRGVDQVDWAALRG